MRAVTLDELCAQTWEIDATTFYRIVRMKGVDQLEMLMDALDLEVTTEDASWHVAESEHIGNTVQISFARGDF